MPHSGVLYQKTSNQVNWVLYSIGAVEDHTFLSVLFISCTLLALGLCLKGVTAVVLLFYVILACHLSRSLWRHASKKDKRHTGVWTRTQKETGRYP